MWKTFSHGHILSNDLRVLSLSEERERGFSPSVGRFFQAAPVLFWLLDQLSRCIITSGSHFLKPPTPLRTDPENNIFVIPTLRPKSAETWKVQERGNPPERITIVYWKLTVLWGFWKYSKPAVLCFCCFFVVGGTDQFFDSDFFLNAWN